MKLPLLYLLVSLLVIAKIAIFGKAQFKGLRARGTSNSSSEHTVRKLLLNDYDTSVIPNNGSGPLNVLFGLKINRLIKVDSKEQILSIDTWVIMRWENTFLKWDKNEFGGLEITQFKPSEIWFPDVQLYNNGDAQTSRAGGREKFLSDVQVNNDGTCVWSGPATFKVNCEMKLGSYPFDRQSCEMRFGSFNYARNKVRLKQFKTKKNKADRFLESGDWELSDFKVEATETDHGNCCPYKFSEIRISIDMRRRFKYHLFYLVAPCCLLAFLSLLSFFIPTESGERIGFVTTLLLGMMVFLLIIPDSLPESSQSIPILGVLMMATMIMISLILFVTILILKCFHSKRTPPRCLRKSFARTPSHKPISKSDFSSTVGVDNINLRAVAPDSRPQSFDAFVSKKEMDNEATWQAFSRTCDKVMFVVFFVFTITMFGVTLSIRD